MQTGIHTIRSYEDISALRAIIHGVLWHDPEIVSVLKGKQEKLVVIKPNWIQESHERCPDVWLPLITHPTLVLTAVEEVASMIEGRATIAVCDAPHTYADFGRIVSRGRFMPQYNQFRSRWPKLHFELLDLRREIWLMKKGVVVERRGADGDPRGYVRINLGDRSHFFGYRGEGHYYGADYDSEVVNLHHVGSMHEYLIAGTPMACDLFINLPKLKTHKKAGITCCLKNLVGINGDKNWLPHHTERSSQWIGDEFPDHGFVSFIESSLKKCGRSVALKAPLIGPYLYQRMRDTGIALVGNEETSVRNGNWFGNDTLWRMVLDLNRAFFYGGSVGMPADAQNCRRYLAIVDGIVGGEGNGPVCPDAVESGVVITGSDPAEIDATAARLMGFDPKYIPIIKEAFNPHVLPISRSSLEDARVWDQRVAAVIPLEDVNPTVRGGFRPNFGWMDRHRV